MFHMTVVERWILCGVGIFLIGPTLIFYGMYTDNTSVIVYGAILQFICYCITPIRRAKQMPPQVKDAITGHPKPTGVKRIATEQSVSKELPTPDMMVLVAVKIDPLKKVTCPYCAGRNSHPKGSGKAGLKVCKHCNLPFVFYQIPTNPKLPNKEV